MSRRMISAVAAAAVLAGIGFYWSKGTAPTAPQAGGAPGGAPPVTVSTPQLITMTAQREITGQFAAYDSVDIKPRVGGTLAQIAFADGQMVNKGDLLFVIDPRPFEAALSAARARLEQALAARELAGRQLNRAGELRQKDFVAQSTFDQRSQDQRATAAQVDAAQADLRMAELNLEFSRITAPFSGQVGAHQVSVGALISGGAATGSTSTVLTTLVSQDPLYFTFDLSEADYLALRKAAADTLTKDGGLQVALQASGEKGWDRKGKLSFIDNQVDRGSGTVRARVTLANPDRSLTPGQFGRVQIPLSAPHPSLSVPEVAVVTDQSRKLVMTVAEDGTVVPKPVDVGILAEGRREVLSGLTPADRVIVNGLLRARPGAKVTAQEAAGGAPAPAASGAPAGAPAAAPAAK